MVQCLYVDYLKYYMHASEQENARALLRSMSTQREWFISKLHITLPYLANMCGKILLVIALFSVHSLHVTLTLAKMQV